MNGDTSNILLTSTRLAQPKRGKCIVNTCDHHMIVVEYVLGQSYDHFRVAQELFELV